MKTSKLLLSCLLAAAFCIGIHNEVLPQSGQKYATGGNNLSNGDRLGSNNYADLAIYTNSIRRAVFTKDGRFGLGTSAPFALLHVSGGSVLFEINATIDSLLSAGSLIINGFSRFNGIADFGNLTINGANSSISSLTGTINFLNSNLLTGANIAADSINANYLSASGQIQAGGLSVTNQTLLANVQADSINTNYLSANSINSGQYLLNNIPLQASPWTFSGSDIYFTGKVGINTNTPPSFPLEVNGNAAITGTLFADRIAVQNFLSIGQFRFINGATQPGQADTIRTPSRLVIESDAQSVSFIADTVRMGDVRIIKETTKEVILAKKQLEIASEDERIDLEADTVTVKERLGIGVEKPSVALDVSGNIRASGTVSADSLNVSNATFTKLNVSGRLKIGASSIVIEDLFSISPTGANHIYTSDGSGDMLINSPIVSVVTELPHLSANTILNANDNTGNVGIGTTNPNSKLHVLGFIQLQGHLIFNSSGVPNGVINWPANGSLSFRTNATPGDITNFNTKMTIVGSTGNVGIGTTLPGAKLHVNGTFKLTDGTQQDGYVLTSNAFGNASWQALADDGDWTRPSGNIMHTTNLNDNVGIGTINPVVKLDVAGSGSNTFIRVRNTATTAGGIILEGGAGGQQVFIASTGNGNTQEGNKLVFKNQDTTDVFVIDLNNGNVGIGTTSPSTRLHVVGNNNNGTTATLKIQSGSQVMLLDGNEIDGTNAGLFLNHNVNQNVIMATGGGNVGIGTTTPNFKLDVCGIIRSTEVIVESFGGCDFVFNSNYPLLALKERKKIVLKNKHLLYIKPAREMQEKGAEMGATIMGLVRNSEEHELYLYEQDERNDKQDERDEMLEKRMEELEKRDKEKEKKIKELEKENTELKRLHKKAK